MKRSLIAIVLLALVSIAAIGETSAYYPLRVDVVKVYSHSDGYRVLYRVGTSGIADVYLPISWFVPGGKGELVRADDPSFPYITVFYKDGKFDHLRLYVKTDTRDSTWGVLPPSDGIGKFSSDELKILF